MLASDRLLRRADVGPASSCSSDQRWADVDVGMSAQSRPDVSCQCPPDVMLVAYPLHIYVDHVGQTRLPSLNRCTPDIIPGAKLDSWGPVEFRRAGAPTHENGWGPPFIPKTYESIKTMSMLYLLC